MVARELSQECIEAINEKVAELMLCFPSVAPQLNMNIELDKDPYEGFDEPRLKTLAKHQVPLLLKLYEDIGAFVRDSSRMCGYRSHLTQVGSDKKMSPTQLSRYLQNYADDVSTRIVRGHPYKIAAFSVPLTEESCDKLYRHLMPMLREIAGEPLKPGARPFHLVFGSVHERK